VCVCVCFVCVCVCVWVGGVCKTEVHTVDVISRSSQYIHKMYN